MQDEIAALSSTQKKMLSENIRLLADTNAQAEKLTVLLAEMNAAEKKSASNFEDFKEKYTKEIEELR